MMIETELITQIGKKKQMEKKQHIKFPPKNARNFFNKLYRQCEASIPYQVSWSDGKGWHPHLVEGCHAPLLQAGEIVKTESPGGRRMLILGTPFGNIAVYDRYGKKNSREKPWELRKDLTMDAPQVFYENPEHKMEEQHILKLEDMIFIFGNTRGKNNFGRRHDIIQNEEKCGEIVRIESA